MPVDQNKAVIKLKIQPRSSRNEVVGFLEDGTLKIKLSAPPVEGQANQAVIKFLAEILNLPAGNIVIISGKTSHNKLISIQGITQEDTILLLKKSIK